MTLLKDTAYIGIGSNLGDRRANIDAAIESLKRTKGVEVVSVSNYYETQALKCEQPSDDPDFLNAAVKIETSLGPEELLDELAQIEGRLGRESPRPKDSPRTIDLDILLFGDKIIGGRRLRVPHPGLTKRMFVLRPLCDIAPDLKHPVSGLSMLELMRGCIDKSNIKRL